MPSKFFQKVVSLSKTPADFRRDAQVIATIVDKPSSTVEDTPAFTVEDRPSSTVEDCGASIVAFGPASTVEAGEYWAAEGAPGIFTASRVRQVVMAQDSLTHVEEAVYDVLWGPKRKADQEEHRTVRKGYAELASKSRVSKRTIQSVVDRLIEKRFITIVEPADIYHRKPTVYLVRGYAAVLAAQRAEGKTWVLRTGRGVFFAHRLRLSSTVAVGISSTVEAATCSTVAPASMVAVEARSSSTVAPASTTSLGIKKEPEGTSSAAATVVGERLRQIITIDDDAIAKIIASCRNVAADASAEEIAHFASVVIGKHRRNPKISNITGLMIGGAVAKYFSPPASELASLRATRADKLRKEMELAREILEDPKAGDQEKAWARELIG